MQALKRSDEIIIEDQWSEWIRQNLKWMIAARPNGDGWKLITDYKESNTVE